MNENADLKAYNDIYLDLLLRYKDIIEEKEALYLADLPKLVTPADENVMLLAKEIQKSFPVFNYDSDFAEAVKVSYSYIREKILPISLPIQFWLKPAQTIRYSAGDIFDRAVLLCSLLIAIGNVSTRIIVATKDNSRSFVVYSEFAGKIIAVDMERGITEFDSLEKLIDSLHVGEGEETSVYEFNDKMYRDII